MYNQLLEQWQPEGDEEREKYADALKAKGDVLQFLDQREEALQHYDDALQIYRQVGARLGEANTLKAKGDVLQFLDQREEALQHYDDALQIYRQVGARLGEANTLKAKGSQQSEPQQGLEFFQAAQEIYTSIGDQYSQGVNLLNIAEAHRQLNDIPQALRDLSQTALLAESIHFQPLKDYAEEQIAKLQQTRPKKHWLGQSWQRYTVFFSLGLGLVLLVFILLH